MLPTLRRLFEHMGWADDRILQALAGQETLPTNAKLLAHLAAAEAVWLARLRGVTSPVPTWPDLSITECGRLLDDNRSGYSQYLKQLTDADLQRDIDYRNSAGNEFRTPVVDILLQVALHGSYHRGQLAALLRREGVPPPSTDYIKFVRGVPAARAARPEAG